jgi:dolichol kinase
MTQIDNGTIRYRDELFRKLIHLTSLSIPIVYYFISTETAALILAILATLALIIDLARYFHPETGKVFYMIFGFLLRQHEVDHKKKTLNGATYVLISALIGVLIFPKIIFVSAFSILIISDSLAALIGRKFGRRRFLFKSLEGTLTFFISACIVILFTPKIGKFSEEYIIGFVAAIVGAIVENISFRLIDDNLSIPLAVGFTMWGLYLALLPNLELTLSNVPR